MGVVLVVPNYGVGPEISSLDPHHDLGLKISKVWARAISLSSITRAKVIFVGVVDNQHLQQVRVSTQNR